MTYEAWLIEGDVAVPAGVFAPDDGAVDHRLAGTAVAGALVGITVEPEGGSPSPTGEVLFLGEL